MRHIPLKLWLLILLSAVLQTLPYPIAGPIPAWRAVFAWIALSPWLFSLLDTDHRGYSITRVQATALSYLCGILWYLGDCYWIYQTMYIYGGLAKPIAAGILLLFSLYLGLYHALFGFLIASLRNSRIGRQRALLLSPFVWVAVELARARITSFPWDFLGITQIDNPVLMHLAPITGAYGISFVVAAVNALWLMRIHVRDRRHTRMALSLAGVALVLVSVLSVRMLHTPSRVATHATATLVQENLGVGAESRGNSETTRQLLDSFTQLSLSPPADRCFGIPELASTRCIHFEGIETRVIPAGLIAWPESPAGFRTDDPVFQARLSALARTANAPLVIGSLGVVPDRTAPRGVRVYDSAALIHADGSAAGRYDKIHLVPFGEYVPFKELFFFADRLTAGSGDMDRGTDRTVMHVDGHAVGVFICYESIFGDEVRRFVQNGAEVLVNISDDGWYGDTSAAWQHLNMVRMRAIENRRWILRSTNTGVTAAVDPYGHVTASVARHIRTALHAGFNYESELTFYTLHGDLFAYACSLITVVALAYGLRQKIS
ncbi:MAG TPA: apolipoprotein N-acyltransferase [Granulicella sp.]